MIDDKPNIILLGGGGHCKSVIDVIELQDKFNIKGILEPNPKSSHILNYPVLGSDNMISQFCDEKTYFLITVGQIKSPAARVKLSDLLEKNNAKIATVISPRAHISKYATIKEGSVIMHHAVVNADAMVGKHCIINTLANIEHDVIIENYCHISTAAVINGESVIGQKSFIGSNATISNGINIPDNSVISAGKFIKK